MVFERFSQKIGNKEDGITKWNGELGSVGISTRSKAEYHGISVGEQSFRLKGFMPVPHKR